MSADQFDLAIRSDSAKQQGQTAAAIIAAAALTAVVAWMFVQLGSFWPVAGLIILLSIKCPQFFMSIRDTGNLFLAETFAYFCALICLPGILLLLPGTSVALLMLCSMYEDLGRFQISLNCCRLANIFSSVNPTLPSHARSSSDTAVALLLYQSGHYAEALKMAVALTQHANEEYIKNPTPENLEVIGTIQGVTVAMLSMSGQTEQAQNLWTDVKTKGDFSSLSRPTSLGYVFANLSWGANNINDFSAANSYAVQALEAYERGALTSKFLRGNIAANRAMALFGLRRVDDAEAEANKALEIYTSYLPATSALCADVYYLQGLIAMNRGNAAEAEKLLKQSISIRREKFGAHHPKLSDTLTAYIKCLREQDASANTDALQSEIDEIRNAHQSLGGALPAEKSVMASATPASETNKTQLVAKACAKANPISTIVLQFAAMAVIYWVASALKLPFPMFLTVISSIALSIAATKLAKSLLQQRLTSEMRDAAAADVSMRFTRSGSFFAHFQGTVTRGADSLPADTTIELSVVRSLTPKLFNDSEQPAQVFLSSRNQAPLLVLSGGEPFVVARGLATSIPVPLRGPLATATSVAMFMVVVIVTACVTLSSTPAGSGGASGATSSRGPLPEKVPDGLTAQRYYDMGVAYKDLGWTEQSRDALQRAIKLGNGDKLAVKAKRFLETKLPRYPVTTDAIHMNIKGFNLGLASEKEAESTWLECIKKYPNFEWPYSNLGQLYVKQRKYQDAERVLHKALEINPSYVNAWINLCECKTKQRDMPAARDCIKHAIELDPDDPRAKVISTMLELEGRTFNFFKPD